MSPTEALDLYSVDAVLPTTDVNANLARYCLNQEGPKKAFAIPGQVSAETTFLPFDETNFSILKRALEESRIVKDAYEIALLRRANEISSRAHIAVLTVAQSASNERELEATFIATCMANGCREQSYHPILASGTSAATLHYQKNDADLVDPTTGERKLNLLIDAGGEYRTYCADITRVFPLSGKFSPESREIYNIVLEMQETCFAMLKADVMWEDVHVCAHRTAIRGLLSLGILRGTEDELFEQGISVAFFPHGVGHYLGMDTHDVGGNPRYDDRDPMFRYLRIRGRLPPGAVVTVEPGVSWFFLYTFIFLLSHICSPMSQATLSFLCGSNTSNSQIYFCRFIIDAYASSPELGQYIDAEVLERYWSVGGIRIEDNVVITREGYDNLTTAPKTLDEVERLVGE